MKKLFKILFKTTIAFILMFIVVFMFLLSDWNSLYKKEDFIFLKTEVQKAKSEDFSDVPELYDQIYNVKNYKTFHFNRRLKLNRSSGLECPCSYVIRYGSFFSSSRFKSYANEALYTLKLEQDFSQEDCLKFLLKNFDFLEHKGIKKASNYYFEKDLNDLNLDEKLTLIVMFKNPSLYNPKRRPELIKEKVEVYKNRLN